MIDLTSENSSQKMSTLTEVMEMLKKNGYENDFQMTDRGMTSKGTNEVFKPEDLVIKGVFRFEGESNPEDMSVLYQMESKSGTKGIFLDAFGFYGSYDGQELAEFFRQIKREDDPSELH